MPPKSLWRKSIAALQQKTARIFLCLRVVQKFQDFGGKKEKGAQIGPLRPLSHPSP
tara:strand:- start:1572 stop:1739 length:168 start_codon:yes stop_codon:yes gene_type:complete